ncbi:MAG: L-dopachrome tautomerase-related protein [Bacteroidota bacterium]
MFKPFICILCLSAITFRLQAQERKDLAFYFKQAQLAHSEGRKADYLSNMIEADKLRPNHQILMYHLACAYAVNEKLEESTAYLRRALIIKGDLDIENNEQLAGLRSNTHFDELVELKEKVNVSISSSEEAFKLDERDLHIESIAFDPIESTFYLGSVHKRLIISIGNDGVPKRFKNQAQDGLWSVMGMKVDAQRRLLWVCTTTTTNMADYTASESGKSSIMKYDLNTGKLLQRYSLKDSLDHWFGDLTVSSSGDVYISDSQTNQVYTINEEMDRLEVLFESETFLSLQGIAYDDRSNALFIADYVKGIYRIDLSDKTLIKVNCGEEVSLKSVDGLYLYKNSLIATQNLVVPMRVTRYYLNKAQDKITQVEYLEKGNPLLNEPTLGVIVENEFYYVANSQWGGYDKEEKILPVSELEDIVILKARLK